ncbi:hypothetical protein ACIQYS_12745 [Psychrobacillus sp. NPDC096426]|uniref:hypothetical protein n=1 Tax=Psychrobacillus sp. NPDC096426 TaxID=3364491 RepID=UPI0037F8D01F
MENRLSREMEWFVGTLLNEFGVEVEVSDIGIEATELGMDEVEDFFVPMELFGELPETLVYEIMIVDDEKNNVWVGAISFYPDSPEWCLQVVTKNGELVFRNVLPLPH